MTPQSHRFFLFPACFLLALLTSASMADTRSVLAWDDSTDIAEGRGERGPWQQNDSRYDFVDDPSVAIIDRGEIAVVWVDQIKKDLFFQRLSSSGSKQGKPINVSRSPTTFSWLPRIVVAPDTTQTLFVLWQEIIFAGGAHGGDILFAKSSDGGKSFSEPLNISHSIGGDGKGRINKDIWHNGSYDLIAGGDGALYAAWTEYNGQLWFSRSTDDGATFSQPRQLTGGGSSDPARAPSLTLGLDRTLYIAWTVGENRAADIHLSKSIDGGDTFSAPQIVTRSKTYSDAPKLAVDPKGVLHLVYAESSGGPFARYQIRHTRSINSGNTFEAPRDISSPMPTFIESAAFPSLSIDTKGSIYVVWEQYPDHRQRPRGLGITVSRDGGESFAPPSMIPDSVDEAGGFNGSTQGLLMKKLAVSGKGAVAVVNSSMKLNDRSRVWLMRGQLRD